MGGVAFAIPLFFNLDSVLPPFTVLTQLLLLKSINYTWTLTQSYQPNKHRHTHAVLHLPVEFSIIVSEASYLVCSIARIFTRYNYIYLFQVDCCSINVLNIFACI